MEGFPLRMSEVTFWKIFTEVLLFGFKKDSLAKIDWIMYMTFVNNYDLKDFNQINKSSIFEQNKILLPKKFLKDAVKKLIFFPILDLF